MKGVDEMQWIRIEKSQLKYLGMAMLLLLYCYLQYNNTDHSGGNMATLYQGAPPGSQAYSFLLFYFGFAMPSFLIYAKATDYSTGYGPLLASRHRTRAVLVNISLQRVAKMLLLFEAFKIAFYGLTLFVGTGFHLPQATVMFFYYCLWDFVSLFAFLGVQTMVELLSSPQIALLITHGFFLFVVAISDVLMVYAPSSWINILLPINHQMVGRFSNLQGDFTFNSITVISTTCLGGVVLYAIGLRLFKRKDIL